MVTLLSFSVATSIFINKKTNPNLNLSAGSSGSYTFSDTSSAAISCSTYQNNYRYYINSFTGYMAFINTANANCTCEWGDGATHGYHYFDGKTVFLNKDIIWSLGDSTYNVRSIHAKYQFWGTFDGQGHSIDMDGHRLRVDSNKGGIITAWNGGTIKDLKIKNSYFYATSGSGKDYIGAIAGTNMGTIKTCIVENFSILSSRWDDDCLAGAIVGENNKTVKDCMVLGKYKYGGETDGAANDGVYANAFCGSGNSATNSIFHAEVSASLGYGGSNSTNNTSSLGSNFKSCEDAYDRMEHEVYISGTEGADCEFPFYEYWNKNHGFDDDSDYCVYLRVFIEWTTLTFTAENGGRIQISGGGTYSGNKVIVPSDYTDMEESSMGSYTILKLYNGGIVTPILPNDFYRFDDWNIGDTNAVATFEKFVFAISFKEANHVIIERSNLELNTQYYLAESLLNQIKISYKTMGKGYKSITFSFKDHYGNTRSIKYTIESGFYITDNTLTNASSYYLDEDRLGVTVNIEPFIYNVILK